jgi:hypothetical protein
LLLVIKRTSVKLRLDLVAEASAVLGTSSTIHRALEEVVRRERLRRLADELFADLTDEALQALRATS